MSIPKTNTNIPEMGMTKDAAARKVWCVVHKPTRTLLHIRITDHDGNLMFTAYDSLDWWVARDEAQALAQASLLGDDFVASFFTFEAIPAEDFLRKGRDMTKDEALRMALEVLESSRVFVTSREKIKHPEGTDWYDERIAAIKEALAEQKQEPVAWMVYTEDGKSVYVTDDPTDITPTQKALPLWAHPRAWVGLTDEEYENVLEENYPVIRACEILKEKNT